MVRGYTAKVGLRKPTTWAWELAGLHRQMAHRTDLHARYWQAVNRSAEVKYCPHCMTSYISDCFCDDGQVHK